MIFLQLLRQAMRISLLTPFAWACGILAVGTYYIYASVNPLRAETLFLNCIFALLYPYMLIVTSLSLIVIGSEPPPQKRLTVSRLFSPGSPVTARFIITYFLTSLCLIAVWLPGLMASPVVAELDTGIALPHISPWWSVLLIVIIAPFIITLELAQREVVLNNKRVIPAIKSSWALMLRNIPLLVAVFASVYLARVGASSLPAPYSLLLPVFLVPLTSVFGTRAFIHVVGGLDEARSEPPA